VIAQVAAALGLAGAVVVALGFLPGLHRAADSLALLRPLAAALCLAGVVAAEALWLRAGLAAVAVLAAVTLIPHVRAQPAGRDLRVYTKNVWVHATDHADLARDIRAARPDVVLLQEVHLDAGGGHALLAALAASHPHQHVCIPPDGSGVVVASRHPFDGAPLCTRARALAAAPIAPDGRRIWIVALHLPWPWPVDSADSDAQAVALLSGLDGPVVVGGDFNAFPWTARVARVARAARGRLAGPARATFPFHGLPLPLDAVIAPGGGRIEARPRLTSDHRGLVADVSLRR
jgi:endonuclease/exonuclease/phosphatase (EEP) superfamily protein YafD